jgi:delta-aminolevulinic acid dehydratase/porphobilinogen synthase
MISDCKPCCFSAFQKKDDQTTVAYARNGIVPQAVRSIKVRCSELVVITDVCLCECMSHGHCGVTRMDGEHFHVLYDESVELRAETALSHAAAGADLVTPSDMMDGRIGAIRETLDANGFDQTRIVRYAAKFASAFHGCFATRRKIPRSSATAIRIRWTVRILKRRCAKSRSISTKARDIVLVKHCPVSTFSGECASIAAKGGADNSASPEGRAERAICVEAQQ